MMRNEREYTTKMMDVCASEKPTSKVCMIKAKNSRPTTKNAQTHTHITDIWHNFYFDGETEQQTASPDTTEKLNGECD